MSGTNELISNSTWCQMKAFADVLAERERQDKMWGEQNHHPRDYFLILSEEVGELGTEIAEGLVWPKDGHNIDTVREEAVHVAAVALAMVECIDRDKWKENR